MGAMPRAPRILSISFSNFNEDARVLRQLGVLAEFGDVSTVGYGEAPALSAKHYEIPESLPSLPQTLSGVVSLALRRHKAVELAAPAAVKALELLRNQKFDLIVANEARALPLAHAVAQGAPIWGDMHEWAPEERTHVTSWRILVAPFMSHICAKFLPMTSAVTTVNGSIAKLYDKQFGIHTEVVRNSIAFQDLHPSAMEPGRIRLAHSGAAVPGRNIENLIEATLALDDRFTLDLYLVKARDGGRYWDQLRDLSRGSNRVTFHEAVAPGDLPSTLNAYDIGVFVLPPQTTNHRFMLPNKFFDFVQARLALVFSPSVETSTLIEQHDLGRVTDDFSVDSLVKVLRELSSDSVAGFKKNVHHAAQALSSEEDVAVQRGIITRLLG